MCSKASTGNNEDFNTLLDGAAATEIEVKANTVAVVTTPRTDEELAAFNQNMDTLSEEGKTSLADILEANTIPEIDRIRGTYGSSAVDCSKGGLVEIPEFEIYFQDTEGNRASPGSMNAQWVVELAIPEEHYSSFNGTLMKTVIGDNAKFDDLSINCDNYKHINKKKGVKTSIRVISPEEIDLVKEIEYNVFPAVITAGEFTTADQAVDCSVGGMMSMYDIEFSFYDDSNVELGRQEVFVGSETIPWVMSLGFSSDAAEFVGNTRLNIENNAIVFDELKVNCSSFMNERRRKSIVLSAVLEEGETKIDITATYTVALIPETGGKSDNNWQQRINMVEDDGTIRLLGDRAKCLQMKETDPLKVRKRAPIFADCVIDPVTGAVADNNQFEFDEGTGWIIYKPSIKPDEERNPKNNKDAQYCLQAPKKYVNLEICDPTNQNMKWWFDNGIIRLQDESKWNWCIFVRPYSSSFSDELPAADWNKKNKAYKISFNKCLTFNSFGELRDQPQNLL